MVRGEWEERSRRENRSEVCIGIGLPTVVVAAGFDDQLAGRILFDEMLAHRPAIELPQVGARAVNGAAIELAVVLVAGGFGGPVLELRPVHRRLPINTRLTH